MFGTTPGGSKIVYDRLYLLKVRDSPASHVSYIQSNIFRIAFGPKTSVQTSALVSISAKL